MTATPKTLQALTVCLLGLALTAQSQAHQAQFSPRNTLISRGALAGVRPGMSPAQVIVAWGAPSTVDSGSSIVRRGGRDLPAESWNWNAVGDTWAGNGSVEFVGGRADSILIALRETPVHTGAGDRYGTLLATVRRHDRQLRLVRHVMGPQAYLYEPAGGGYYLIFQFVPAYDDPAYPDQRLRLNWVSLARSIPSGCGVTRECESG